MPTFWWSVLNSYDIKVNRELVFCNWQIFWSKHNLQLALFRVWKIHIPVSCNQSILLLKSDIPSVLMPTSMWTQLHCYIKIKILWCHLIRGLQKVPIFSSVANQNTISWRSLLLTHAKIFCQQQNTNTEHCFSMKSISTQQEQWHSSYGDIFQLLPCFPFCVL